MPKITKHGKKRLSERAFASSSAGHKLAKKAYSHGLRHNETLGDLHAWMDSQFLKHKTGDQLRIYGGNLYVFCHDVLITVYPIPQNIQFCLERYVEPVAYRKYTEYTNTKKSSKAEQSLRKKAEAHEAKRQAFKNRVILDDIRDYLKDRDDVEILGVHAENEKIVVRYIPARHDIPDLSELVEYLRAHTHFSSVRLLHIKDQYGKPIFKEKYRIDATEDELVYRI